MNNVEQILTLRDGCIEILNATKSFDQVAPDILEKLGKAFLCDWGTYWKVDSATLTLIPTTIWSLNPLTTKSLKKDTQNRHLSLSEGNAGHVWRSRTPIYTTDLIKDMCLPRSLDALEAGLQGGLWFALKTNHAVYGVLELLGKNLQPVTSETLLNIEILGLKLGEKIEKSLEKNPSLSSSNEILEG